MQRIIILTISLLGIANILFAEEAVAFSNIGWNSKITSLPVYTETINLGRNFSSYSNKVVMEYPEYKMLTEAEVEALNALGYKAADTLTFQSQLGVSRKEGLLEVSFVPVVKLRDTLFRLTSCKLSVQKKNLPAKSKEWVSDADMKQSRYQQNSVLSKGKWAKIRVKKEGVYALTPSFISSLGFNDLSKIKVYGYGGRPENDIIAYDASPTSDYDDLEEVPLYRRGNDALFFAEGTIRWSALKYSTASTSYASTHQNNPYSSYSYYFITEGDSAMSFPDEEIEAISSSDSITIVPAHALIDNDEYSWYTSGRNLFEAYNYGEKGYSKNYTLATPNAVSSKYGSVYLSFTMCNTSRSSLTLSHNNTSLGSLSISAKGEYDYAVLATKAFTSRYFTDNNTINIKTPVGVDARLDYIRADYFRDLYFTGGCMPFRHYSTSASQYKLKNATQDVQVWRLGYPGHPTARVKGTFANGVLSCLVDNPSLRYVAVDVAATYETPEKVGVVTNQNLHADASIDMVIIVPESGKLIAQAQRLASYHQQKDGLRVKVVSADALYNEFSSGTPDIGAYRRYLKMLYDRAEADADAPRYLLLFGACMWDNRMLTTQCKRYDPKDYLLCYESENSLNKVNSYVSEDYIGLLDDEEGASLLTEKIDIGIGRIPVTTASDAKIVVDKLISYMNNSVTGSWKNDVYMVADDGDNNMHMTDAESISQMIESTYPKLALQRVYSDAYTRVSSATGNTYPDVTTKLKDIMNKRGALLMNYMGHGAPYGLSHENLLKTADFKEALSDRIPMWVVASCELTPYDMLTETIGEVSLLNEKSAAIGFFSSSRDVYATQNGYLNTYFMNYIFGKDEKGKRNRLGDAVRLTKVRLVSPTSSMDVRDYTFNKLKYALMGDPALTLAMPTNNVVIDSINGINLETTSEFPQLSAGDVATIVGHIEDASGNMLPSFNGTVTLTLKDSKDTVTCHNNAKDDVTAFQYSEYTKSLYEGSDSVRNGSFKTKMPIPFDLKYTNLQGRLNSYAVNNDKTIEANGACYDFIVGGTSASYVDDGEGPSIIAYLNTPEFKDGATVNETPFFYAYLNDSSGINAAGNGIGHDLELVIDGKESTTYNLNNYYTNDFGSYASGSVAFTIPTLAEGEHSLLFRAWDVNNHSASKKLTFNVVKGLNPTILQATVSKNPATTATDFIIKYDRPDTEAKFTVTVFDSMGRQWWQHQETGSSSAGYYTIHWNLNSNSGVALPSGLYLYKIGVTSNGSGETTKTQKLIIHKQ